MDTKKVGIFLRTVQAGSMKKAAEQLNYTQSSLIYTINSLEQELDIQLLNRTPKGVSLTDAGVQLSKIMEELLEKEAFLLKTKDALKAHQKSLLRIGTYPVFARFFLSKIIERYLKTNKDCDIEIHAGNEKDLNTWLNEKSIDIAIGEPTLRNKDKYAWTYLMDDEIYAAIPANRNLPPGTPLTIEHLKQYSVFLSGYNSFNHSIETLMKEHGVMIKKIKVAALDSSVVLSMVQAHRAIAFLSGLYLEECPPNVTMHPLDPPVIRQLGFSLAASGHVLKHVHNFVSYLQKQFP